MRLPPDLLLLDEDLGMHAISAVALVILQQEVSVLRKTFIHIPGVGIITERWLWEQGVHNWDDCFSNKAKRICSYALLSKLERHVEESVRNLEKGKAAYFEQRLPSSEIWRLYPDFEDSVAFLDIETTGFRGQGNITVIGLYDGKTYRVFVSGRNMNQFKKELRKYALLVTYNGRQFDVPFIRDAFGELPADMGHIDLRYPLRRLGYTGGLKAIEKRMRLCRDEMLDGLDGLCAVWLWQEYENGNEKALETLIRYNFEDVVVLRCLAETVYNRSVEGLPIPIRRLSISKRPTLDLPYDERLVRKLVERRLHFL